LPLDVLERVIQGGAAKVAEAGVFILGGHSVDDPEPKYGLVAIGTVQPSRVIRNVGAQPGDTLILTKPLGIGILTTAIKRGMALPAAIDGAVEVMSTLNRAAGEVMVRAGAAVHAATDVTGFGLLGHLSEMLGNGDVGARVSLEQVPVLADAWTFADDGVVPGGTRRNLNSVEGFMDWSERITPTQQLVLADAQTSGGLLMAVDPSAAEALLADLHAHNVSSATPIGEFTSAKGRINVV
jgi:selenide,water dikinase